MTFFFSRIPLNDHNDHHDGRYISMFISEDTIERMFYTHFTR